MRARVFLPALVITSLVASAPGCVVARWRPLAATPEGLDAHHRRTIRAVRPDGSHLTLEQSTIASDTLRGLDCRDPGGPRACLPYAVPMSDLRAIEVRSVNVAASVLASVAATAGITLGAAAILAPMAEGLFKGMRLPIPF